MGVTDFDIPDDWYGSEERMFDRLVGGNDELGNDYHLQDLFDDALFNDDLTSDERSSAYEELVDYLYDEYGIDFEQSFDWEDYREWYDSA